MYTILITTSSFSKNNSLPLKNIEEHGGKVILNPYGQKLSEEELSELLTKYRPIGLIAGVEPITDSIIRDAAPYLKVISRVGVGWDNVDHEAAKKFGIKVFRTPDAVTRAVVELTVGLFIALSRHISLHDRDVRKGKWHKRMGALIQGKLLSVIGCGRIGKGVCLAMRNLGCNVQALDPCQDVEWHRSQNIPLIYSMEEVLKTSDLISIHASIPEASTCLINKNHLELAKPSLILINLARGGIVDEEALLEALQNGRIAGAALDVFVQEPYFGSLCKMDNVILTPHIGSYAKESRMRMEEEAVENLLTGLGWKG